MPHYLECGHAPLPEEQPELIKRFKEKGRKPTKAAYRRLLNRLYPFDKRKNVYTGNVRGASKRPYGDYLYAQDPEQFEVDFQAWIAKGRPQDEA